MKKEYLGELEELVLLMILILKEDAYGLAIRKTLKEKAERSITIGAVHGTVNRLENKGFIKSELGGATEIRGGRRKRIFSITAYGMKVLHRSQEVKVNIWNQIPGLSLNQI